ncbi:MAG: hypothetical protein ACW99U_11440 [Candidatus Thorarchaeota archaeon]|jgi:membrane protein implicated in regulation of membrane protease activity
MTMAKKAVDSTVRRLLTYTAEIIMSIILLVLICLPLAFTIPMWVQLVVFDVPRSGLFLDPVGMFGADGAIVVTVALSLVGLILGYPYLRKMLPSAADEDEPTTDKVDEEEEEDVEEVEEEDEDESEVVSEDLHETDEASEESPEVGEEVSE